MSRGKSGLLIASIDPTLKKQLYSRLAAEGQTYKDWLLQRLDRYLGHQQLPLYPTEASSTPVTAAAVGNQAPSRQRKKRRRTSS
jgi:hypothetical protein